MLELVSEEVDINLVLKKVRSQILFSELQEIINSSNVEEKVSTDYNSIIDYYSSIKESRIKIFRNKLFREFNNLNINQGYRVYNSKIKDDDSVCVLSKKL